MAGMSVVETRDDLTQIALSGRLDIEGVHAIESRFTTYAAARRRPTIVDISNVAFLASLGLGMIVGAAKGLNRQGRKLILVAPTPMLERVLSAAAIESIIPIARTTEDALLLLDQR